LLRCDRHGAAGYRLADERRSLLLKARDGHEQVTWLEVTRVLGDSPDARGGVTAHDDRALGLAHQHAE